MFTVKGGAGDIATAQVSINSGSATLVAAARAGRNEVLLKSVSGASPNIFVGDSGITSSTGYRMHEGSGSASELRLRFAGDLYAITDSGGATLQVLETFD